MSHVGSSIESLFGGGTSTSESPNTSMARLVTSMLETVVAAGSVALFVPAAALPADAGWGAGGGVGLLESAAARLGAPATITVCGGGVVGGCEERAARDSVPK